MSVSSSPTPSRYARALIFAGLVWTYVMTLRRGWRWPNDWAEGHWVVTYGDGFIKRGLVGTLVSPWVRPDAPQSPIIIRDISTAALALFSVVLLAMVWRILQARRWSTTATAAALMFVTAPYVVMSGHLNGYFDNLLVLISVGAAVLALRGWSWLAGLVLAIGVLVHETIFVVGFPMVALATLHDTLRDHPETPLKRLAWPVAQRLLGLTIPPVAVFGLIYLNQRLWVDATTQYDVIRDHVASYPFVEHNRAHYIAAAFTKPFLDYYATEIVWIHDRFTRQYYTQSLVPNLLLIGLGWNAVRGTRFAKTLMVLVVFACFGPLALHLIAWDTSRIWTYPTIAALTIAWGFHASRQRHGVADEAGDSVRYVVFALLAVGMHIAISTHLLDGQVDRFTLEERIRWYAPGLLMIGLGLSAGWELVPRGRAGESAGSEVAGSAGPGRSVQENG